MGLGKRKGRALYEYELQEFRKVEEARKAESTDREPPTTPEKGDVREVEVGTTDVSTEEFYQESEKWSVDERGIKNGIINGQIAWVLPSGEGFMKTEDGLVHYEK